MKQTSAKVVSPPDGLGPAPAAYDPARIAKAADNALIGGPATMAQQIQERFHREDRLMLWFDFFNHDSTRVIRNMRAFQEKVVPLLEDAQ